MRTLSIVLSLSLVLSGTGDVWAKSDKSANSHDIIHTPTISPFKADSSKTSISTLPSGVFSVGKSPLSAVAAGLSKLDKDKLTNAEKEKISSAIKDLLASKTPSKLSLIDAVKIIKEYMDQQKAGEVEKKKEMASRPKESNSNMGMVGRDNPNRSIVSPESTTTLTPVVYTPPAVIYHAPLSETYTAPEPALGVDAVVPVARNLVLQAMSAIDNLLGSRIDEAGEKVQGESLQEEIKLFDSEYELVLNKAEFQLGRLDLKAPQHAKHLELYNLITSKELAAAITILTPPKNTHPFLKVMFYRNWNESKAYERVRVTQKARNQKPNLNQLNRKAGFGFLRFLNAVEFNRDSLFTQMLVKRPAGE